MDRRHAPSAAREFETIRIVLVEPRFLAGLGIRGVLDREPDMEVVAEVRTADDALSVAEETAPDVFVLDVELQEPSTSAATHRLAQEAPMTGIVVLGREDDDASILEAIEIGAMGHVAAIAKPAELVAVIRKVAEGDDPLRDEVIGRPDLIDKIMEAFRESFRRAEEVHTNPLTSRELDVLRYVASGMRNRDIADVMEISEQTVKNHVSTILHKLGVANRLRAATFAVREGWLELDEVAAGGMGGTPMDDTSPPKTGPTEGD
jgi:DNA-binding NarL/FixJ family response regulator